MMRISSALLHHLKTLQTDVYHFNSPVYPCSTQESFEQKASPFYSSLWLQYNKQTTYEKPLNHSPSLSLMQLFLLSKIQTFSGYSHLIFASSVNPSINLGKHQIRYNFQIARKLKAMSGKLIHLTSKQSLNQNLKEKMDYDVLSEEQFMSAYNSDPFFKERVNVELEKMIRKENGGHLNISIDECSPEDLGEITLKKQSSQNNGQEYQRYKRYLKFLTNNK